MYAGFAKNSPLSAQNEHEKDIKHKNYVRIAANYNDTSLHYLYSVARTLRSLTLSILGFQHDSNSSILYFIHAYI